MKRFLALFVLTAMVLMLLPSCFVSEFSADVKVSQIDDTQEVLVKIDSEEPIKKVDVVIKHGDEIVSNLSCDGMTEFSVKAYYGKHTVQVSSISINGKVNKYEGEITLTADEYVIAPISGSMPQLYFTLNIKEITNDGEIPAFVWLARPDSYNWDNLPKNVYAMPTVDKSEVLTHNNYDRMVEVTDKYIKELYSLNPNSKFNLYINDFNSYLYLKLLAGNGIPEENYYVTLLSDGGASYTAFNTAFNVDEKNFDADEKYSQMAENLKTLYTQVREKGDYYYEENTFAVNTSDFNQYAYVAAKEMDNVEWWILRPRDGVLCSPDEEFIKTVLTTDKTEGIIEERNFANPLKAMSDEEKAQLKALYNFNGEMFEQAENESKKAMMILGSWATAENEPDFEDYVNIIKAYFGDEFVYYYKGHPNTPTSNHPEKAAQLEKLGLIDVESSINAELILFFYPDIYMCGYNSSTFMSVESEEMACAIFNMTKEDAKANEGMAEYRDLIGVYISEIDDTSYRLELKDGTEKIYNTQTNTFSE